MSLHLLRGHRPPSETQLVESVEGIMKNHGLPRAAFFGHSFGSIAVAWMARRRPQVMCSMSSSTFVFKFFFFGFACVAVLSVLFPVYRGGICIFRQNDEVARDAARTASNPCSPCAPKRLLLSPF